MDHSVHAHHLMAETASEADRRRWSRLVVLSVAQFMLVLDVTVVNVALPSMGGDLHLGREALTWVVTAYTLVFGGLMLLGGRLADVLGARRTLLTGVAVFTLASLVSGLAGDATVLLSGRIAQGLGGALLSPSALAIITTSFPGRERDRALGGWSALGGTGSAVGVLLGGALTAGPGWRWVFFINVPVGLAVLAVLPALVPARPAARGRIDLPGALSATAGTAALIYGLVKAGDDGWGSATTLSALGAALVLYAAFVWVERATAAPLLDVRMLGRRPVASGAFMMLVATALLIAMFFLGSLYFQHVRHDSALQTGLMFLPVAVATGFGAHLASHLVGRVGPRPVAVGGLAVAAAGEAVLTGLTAHGNAFAVVLPGFALAALGLGVVFVAATTTALGYIDHRQAGLASGVISTFHEVGGSIGVAVISTLAATGIRHSTLTGYGTAFTVAAIAAAVAAIVALLLVPSETPHMPAGAHVH
jgi:EmrB/QacA subfamily drug resistance transporter